MGADFPAAHSMDTEWFAVDKDGHVAYFDTGEDGSLPNAATEVDVGEVLRALGSKLLLEEGPEAFGSVVPELARLGLHVYQDASEWFPAPYRRTHRPKKPLHVDQLPPALRDQIKAVRFDDLSFADKERLQPCDHLEGYAWGGLFLSEDGRTVRAVPGHEEEYRKVVEELREEDPEEMKKFRFEGPEEKPKPPKRRPKGGPGK